MVRIKLYITIIVVLWSMVSCSEGWVHIHGYGGTNSFRMYVWYVFCETKLHYIIQEICLPYIHKLNWSSPVTSSSLSHLACQKSPEAPQNLCKCLEEINKYQFTFGHTINISFSKRNVLRTTTLADRSMLCWATELITRDSMLGWPYHHNMACPQITDRRHSLQIWRVAAKVK
jgi:hypothetical protein